MSRETERRLIEAEQKTFHYAWWKLGKALRELAVALKQGMEADAKAFREFGKALAANRKPKR